MAGAAFPDNPAAWLMATAKNRALDERRRGKLISASTRRSAASMDEQDTPDLERRSTTTSATICCG